jgi:hypothetical protein
MASNRWKEASGEPKEALFLMPMVIKDELRKQAQFKKASDIERYIEGLRKVGLLD